MNRNNLNVLITGGSLGLGRLMAESLSSQGHKVFIFSNTKKDEIDPLYISILAGYTECDLGNTEELIECFGALVRQIGRIDILINNAAVRQFNKKLDEFQTGEIQRNISVDFVAPVILTNLCLPIMKKNSFGRIINISSIGAYKVFPNGSLYCSSKRALIAFGETLNKELLDLRGVVTVNTICPDPFSKVNQTKLRKYDHITNSILNNVNRIIRSESKGMVIRVFTFRHKLRESFRLGKLAIQMLIS